MVGDAAGLAAARLQRAGAQQFVDEGAVVQYLVVAAEGAVFVLQHMEAVRVAADDAGEAVFRQGRDIAPGQVLEGRLVAQPARHVAAVALLQAEHGEVHRGCLEDLHEGAQGALVAHVEGAVADPEQHVGALLLAHQRQVQVGRPVQPAAGGEAAGVVGGDQVVQHLGALVRRGAFLQGQVAAHVDDGVDVLDHHRALLDAGPAGGAGPQGVGVDQGLAIQRDDRLVRAAAVLAQRFAWIGAAGELRVVAAGQADDHVLDQLLRVQRLAGGERRAHRLALAALHAGVEPEQLVPGEVAGLFHAQRRLRIGQVERLEAGGAAAAEAFGAAVPGQVQGTGEGMLHRPAPGHAEEQLGHAPGHANGEEAGEEPAAEAFRQDPGHRQGGEEEARGERQQALRQAHPGALRQPRRWVEAAAGDEQRADEHQRRGRQQGEAEDPAVQPETVYQDRQQRRQDEAAGGGDVGPGHVPVALYHMVQVHQVATRHLHEAADPVDFGGSAAAPHEEALRGAEHGKCQGGEEQDGEEGVEHFWSPCGTSGGAGSASSPACGRGGPAVPVGCHEACLRNPCTSAARHRSPHGCCAGPRSRRCGTAGSLLRAG